MTEMVWRVELVVLPKDGVNDPQGEAVKGGLDKLGHRTIERVRVGRHLQLDIRGTSESDVRAQVNLMAVQLLANQVIEQSSISAMSVLKSGEATG